MILLVEMTNVLKYPTLRKLESLDASEICRFFVSSDKLEYPRWRPKHEKRFSVKKICPFGGSNPDRKIPRWPCYQLSYDAIR